MSIVQHLLSKYDDEAGGTDGPVQVHLPFASSSASSFTLLTWALTVIFGLLLLLCILSLDCHASALRRTTLCSCMHKDNIFNLHVYDGHVFS